MKRPLVVLTSCVAGLAVPAVALATAGSEPDDEPAGNGTTPADIDIEFQVDMVLGLVPTDEMNEYYNEQNRDQQLLIQECMHAAGFDYELEVYELENVPDPQAGMSELEWAQQWGFGVYTTMDPENAPWDEASMQIQEWPNQEIVDGMTEGERNTWFQAQNRCWQETSTSVANDPWQNPMVQQALEDFAQLVDNDPRTGEALDTWRDCMDAAGHPYGDVDAMYQDWYDAEKQDQFLQSEAWDPDSPDYAEWQQLVEEEIAVAVASAGCTPAYNDAVDAVRRELRPQLVELWQDVDWSLPPATIPGGAGEQP